MATIKVVGLALSSSVVSTMTVSNDPNSTITLEVLTIINLVHRMMHISQLRLDLVMQMPIRLLTSKDMSRSSRNLNMVSLAKDKVVMDKAKGTETSKAITGSKDMVVKKDGSRGGTSVGYLRRIVIVGRPEWRVRGNRQDDDELGRIHGCIRKNDKRYNVDVAYFHTLLEYLSLDVFSGVLLQ